MALNLLDVNDDCFLEIFENLTLDELAAVASTCTRFRTIARDVFSHCIKFYCLELDLDSPMQNIQIAYRQQATAILRNFGDLFTNVKIKFSNYGGKFNNRFFDMLVMYCSTGSLETLALINCDNARLDKIDNAGALFRKVKVLVLRRSSRIESSFLADAKELTRLTLNIFTNTDDITKILSNDYPRLQSLSLTLRSNIREEIDIVNFLKHHPNVTELELRDGGNYDLSDIDECHWLRKLTVWNLKYCDVSPIARLDKLSSLKISLYCPELRRPAPTDVLNSSKSSQSFEELVFAGGTERVRLVQRFINLRRLSMLSDVYIDDEYLEDIPRLEELRFLSIAGSSLDAFTSDGLLGLVERLPKLEQLSMHPHELEEISMELSESTYSRICEIYRNRRQKLVIYNFDLTDEEQSEMKRNELFAGDDRQTFVQFITLERVGCFALI